MAAVTQSCRRRGRLLRRLRRRLAYVDPCRPATGLARAHVRTTAGHDGGRRGSHRRPGVCRVARAVGPGPRVRAPRVRSRAMGGRGERGAPGVPVVLLDGEPALARLLGTASATRGPDRFRRGGCRGRTARVRPLGGRAAGATGTAWPRLPARWSPAWGWVSWRTMCRTSSTWSARSCWTSPPWSSWLSSPEGARASGPLPLPEPGARRALALASREPAPARCAPSTPRPPSGRSRGPANRRGPRPGPRAPRSSARTAWRW